MFDRVLLILLILLLPLGIVASRFISGEVITGSAKTAEQEKKIETLISNLEKNAEMKGDIKQNNIIVTGIIYATESGKLKVAGSSKELQANFWVWWAGNKKQATTTASTSAQTVAYEGPKVFRPGAGGGFVIELDIQDYSGILEIRLEQGSQNMVLRYDVEKKKQLLD